jgi:ferric-dicitrate binding protein FerR (iron transport regulator)
MDAERRSPQPDAAARHEADKQLARRRRARNWALLVVLVGLSVLFYAITIGKLKTQG